MSENSEIMRAEVEPGFAVSAPSIEPAPEPLAPDHAVVLLNYLLLLLMPLTLGLSGFIAAVIGWIRRGGSDEVARSHFRFQNRTFWLLLVLLWISGVAVLVCAFYAWGSAWSNSAVADGQPPRNPNADTQVLGGLLGLALAAVVFLGGLILGLVRIVYGVVRIAMDRPVGRPRAPARAEAFR